MIKLETLVVSRFINKFLQQCRHHADGFWYTLLKKVKCYPNQKSQWDRLNASMERSAYGFCRTYWILGLDSRSSRHNRCCVKGFAVTTFTLLLSTCQPSSQCINMNTQTHAEEVTEVSKDRRTALDMDMMMCVCGNVCVRARACECGLLIASQRPSEVSWSTTDRTRPLRADK